MPISTNDIDKNTEDFHAYTKSICYNIVTIPMEENNPLKKWDTLFPDPKTSANAAQILGAILSQRTNVISITETINLLVPRMEGETMGHRIIQLEFSDIISDWNPVEIATRLNQTVGLQATMIIQDRLTQLVEEALETEHTLNSITPLFRAEHLKRLTTIVLANCLRKHTPAKVAQYIATNDIAKSILFEPINRLGGVTAITDYLNSHPEFTNMPGVRALYERVLTTKKLSHDVDEPINSTANRNIIPSQPNTPASTWSVQSSRAGFRRHAFHPAEPTEKPTITHPPKSPRTQK